MIYYIIPYNFSNALMHLSTKALVCARFQIKSLVFEFPNSYFLIRYLILLEPFQEHFPSLWLLTLQMKLTLARVEWTLNKFDFDYISAYFQIQ